MKKATIKNLLVVFFFYFSAYLQAQTENQKIAVQQSIDSLILANNLPGLNFSIHQEDGSQLNWSGGYADTLLKKPMTPKDVCFSGSIGKTYAVAVLMQLVDEGKIDLKKRFIEYFPETDWLKDLPNMEKITVEMLLQHTSGLPRYVHAQAVWDSLKSNPDKVWSYYDRLVYATNMEAQHEPGKGWAYSDTNYLLLGMLIENITGMDFYETAYERILHPAGLDETHPSLTRDIPNLANGYCQLKELFGLHGTMVTDGRYAFNPQMEWTGGGFASTTSDLAFWARQYFTARHFSEHALQSIITPNPQGKDLGYGQAYGAGSFIYSTPFGKAWGHTGLMPGYKSVFAYYPEHNLAVALQINCDYADKDLPLTGYLNILLKHLIHSK